MQSFMPDVDPLQGAFTGMQGPRPGVEILAGLAVFPGVALAGLLGAMLLAALAVLAFNFTRRYKTIAVTADEVLVFKNSRWRDRRVLECEGREPLADVQWHVPDVKRGRLVPQRATVGTDQYWVGGPDWDEARRLGKAHRARSDEGD